MDWFYIDVDGESKGPITIEQVKQLPLSMYVWNGDTVQEWTELKDIQSLMNNDIKTMHMEEEYDCQYMDEIDDMDAINPDISDSKATDNNGLNLQTLAVLSQATTHNNEDIVDEELTPEPFIDKPKCNDQNNQILNENVNNKNNIKAIDINIKKNEHVQAIKIELIENDNKISNDSPIPLQDLENKSLPKQCQNPSISYHIIDKIPKHENKAIIAQPPSANTVNNNKPSNMIRCSLCSFYNDIKSIKCSQCYNNLVHCDTSIQNEQLKNSELQLKNQMNELMNELEIPKHARIAMIKLPKEKKIQIIHQYNNMKQTTLNHKRKKKQKKKSLFKKNKTKSNKECNSKLTVNMDDIYNIDARLKNNKQKSSTSDENHEINIAKRDEKSISVYDGYIKKYGKRPQNATQLMKFSKMKNQYTPLTFKQARNLFSIKNKNKNIVSTKKKKSQFWSQKKEKKTSCQKAFIIITPASNTPHKMSTNVQKNAKEKQVRKVVVKCKESNVECSKSIWDINENEDDDPLGSTYRKKQIICNYNQYKSAIHEQTTQSMMKNKMGFIAPESVRMKSVFDESSSDDDDNTTNNNNNNRLTVNLKNAKHNKVSAHFAMKL